MAKLFNYYRFENFLDKQTTNSLLEYCDLNQSKFDDARVTKKNKIREVNTEYRVCLVANDLGRFKAIFREEVDRKFQEICSILKIQPFEIDNLETQIAAHGDGAFFKQHIDTHTEVENNSKNRVISAVYYFFNEPKQFEGGELILHPFPFMDGDDTSVSLTPLHNSLVIFPSFGMHEVLPVKCPNVEFKNWRFAVNCWINKA